MKKEHYVVIAYRWGSRESHSYPIGIFTKKNKAINAADFETQYRGGKYTCVVFEAIPDSYHNPFDGIGYHEINDPPKVVYESDGTKLK